MNTDSKNKAETVGAAIHRLFKRSGKRSTFEFMLAILRVEGMSGQPGWNEFQEPETLFHRAESAVKQTDEETRNREAMLLAYGEILRTGESWDALANLARVAAGGHFSVTPFDGVEVKAGREMPRMLSLLLSSADEPTLAQLIEDAWDQRLAETVRSASASFKDDEVVIGDYTLRWNDLEPKLTAVLEFYAAICSYLREARLEFKNFSRVHPIGNFSEELHLLIDDKVGLYGFDVRRPSNPSSFFTRTETGTELVNIGFGKEGELELWVGDLDEYRKHPTPWSVLHPGTVKYNDKGRWKPLVYPADSTAIQNEVVKTTNDERVQGVLFYSRLTGYKVIEFAVKCSIWLDQEETVLSNSIHLFRVTKEEDFTSPKSLAVYDGWLLVADDTVETIRAGIDEIARTMNILSLAYQQEVTWASKYSIMDYRRGQGKPDTSDMKLFNDILERELNPEAKRIIGAALDWYARGERSNSIFNRFLGFWIAMEGLAVSLHDGKLGDPAPFTLRHEEDSEKTSRVQKCIEEYLAKFASEKDPGLIEQAYFDCIRSLRYKTKEAIRAVFSDERGVVKLLFEEKTDGYTIEEVRHKIAHGDLLEWDFAHESLVRNRLGVLREVAREFILRVLFRTKPEDEIKDWSQLHTMSLIMTDPRSTLVVSDERILPKTDWMIRPEWIEG